MHSKSWTSRVAAAEAVQAIIRQLPTWTPTACKPEPESCESDPHEEEFSPACSFLSLSNLCLDRVLANGARLCSMDQRELVTQVNAGQQQRLRKVGIPAKRGRKPSKLKEFSQMETDEGPFYISFSHYVTRFNRIQHANKNLG